MKTIPVIDILNGVAVHAVKGQRSQYKPLQSNLTKSPDPLEAAETFKKLGFTKAYIADLDAIITCSSNFGTISRIHDQTGLDLLVDSGVTSLQRAQKLLQNGASELIIGTETLQSKQFVAEAVRKFGSERVVVSLDLKGDRVLTKPGFDGCTDAIGLLQEFKAMGVSQVIVLDLLRVGSGEGVNVDFVKRVIVEVGLDVYVGGGVRDIKDLIELKSVGAKGALVATALHNGKITIQQLKQNSLL